MASSATRAGKGAECRMSGYNEIGAMNFAEGFLLAGGQADADAPIWLSEKIGAQKIKSYTDQEILESLSLVRGPLACATYMQMLKLACDAFSKDYFCLKHSRQERKPGGLFAPTFRSSIFELMAYFLRLKT